LFTTFGILLFYTLTNSILAALLFFVIHYFSLVVVRSMGVSYFLRMVNAFGLKKIMLAGLGLSTLALGMLFYVQAGTLGLYIWLILIAVLKGVGETMYWTPSNTILFSFVGNTDQPGHYSAYGDMVRMLAGTLAALLGLGLHVQHLNFLTLFLIAAVLLMGSMIPLWKMEMPKTVRAVPFRQCLQELSPLAFLANIDVVSVLLTIGLPLIILFKFTSFSESVWVSAATAVALILSSYVSAIFTDKKNTSLVIFSFALLLLTWSFYSVAASALQIILLGISFGIFHQIISTRLEARLSREVVNAHAPIEATVSIEFARGLGLFIGASILLIAYLFTKSMPQSILLLGILFLIPKGLYALGIIPQRHSMPSNP